MKELVIYGAGAVGRLAAQIVRDINRHNGPEWSVLGILDDGSQAHHDRLHGLPFLGDRFWLQDHRDVEVVVAIGTSTTRQAVVEGLRRLGHARFATLVHPRAWVGDDAVVGEGCLIYPGSMIDPSVEIGAHVVINKLCTVGHDAVVGQFATLAPSVDVTARSIIGTGCMLGTGCSTLNGVGIGAWSTVGAGSVVSKNLGERVFAVGAPARVIRREPTSDEG